MVSARKQLMCLLISEERHPLPDSVSVLAALHKAGDSVNISISLCWEGGIQFTL